MAAPVSHRAAPARVAPDTRPPRWTFGVCGPRVRVSAGLAALSAFALVFAVSGRPGVGAWLPLLLLANVVVSTAVHEGGHAWAARELGYRVEWVVLGAITGGTAWFGRDDRPLERAAVALAGPAASAALVLGLLGVRVATPAGTAASIVELAIAINVLAMVANLLPFGHSDGALLARGLAAHGSTVSDLRGRPAADGVGPPTPSVMWGPPPAPTAMWGPPAATLPPPPPVVSAPHGPPPPRPVVSAPHGPPPPVVSAMKAVPPSWVPPDAWAPPTGPPGVPPSGTSGGPPGADPTLGCDVAR